MGGLLVAAAVWLSGWLIVATLGALLLGWVFGQLKDDEHE